MPDRPRVALVFVVVGDLRGSGGAERLYSSLHEHLLAHDHGVSTVFVTSRGGLERFQRAGTLRIPAGVQTLALDGSPGFSRFVALAMTAQLLWQTLKGRFDIVHLTTESSVYVPYAALLRWLPFRLRPSLTVNLVDCTLLASLDDAPPVGTYERQVLDAYLRYARWASLDGIYLWYRALSERIRERTHGGRRSLVQAARYCFTDPDRFKPAAKERRIIFAGRLSEQKRPLLFVDAVAALRSREPDLVHGWQFEMYGRGVLADAVARRIAEWSLQDVVTLTYAIDMAPVFGASRLFVSTQSLENFTSLAMLEAMAAGNAVIAEDVGQTREFVTDGQNGLLVRPATPDTFAEAIATYLRHPEHFEAMAAASRRLATDVHTIENFSNDIARFWRDVSASRNAGR